MDYEWLHSLDSGAAIRADSRSNAALRAMFADMATLVAKQQSLYSILRYMIACFNYSTPKIVIGSHPYSDSVVPHLGSSYSQRDGTADTPTTRIVADHFMAEPDYYTAVRGCIRESWKTLVCGCAWFNATYSTIRDDPGADVNLTARYYYTVEFISVLILHQSKMYNNKHFSILAIGREAQFVASAIRDRVILLDIVCKVTQCRQPAQLSRITYNTNLVGRHPDYSCIPPSAKNMLRGIAKAYVSVQGTQMCDIRQAMSKNIELVSRSGLADLGSKARVNLEQLAQLRDCNTQDKEARLDRLISVLQQQCSHNLLT